MKPQTPAILYKAHLRGHTENERQRLLATFNFEGYSNESRTPFGSLTVFNDEVLAPGCRIERHLQPGHSALIIPLTGALEAGFNGSVHEVSPDHCLLIPATTITLKNPYGDELVNFLYIEINAVQTETQTIGFKLDTRNTLHPFLLPENLKGAIGIFDGRQESVYPLQTGKGLFAFVINGAFEIEGRLLETRDGLALWDINEVEMEALSENAVILLLEAILQFTPKNQPFTAGL